MRTIILSFIFIFSFQTKAASSNNFNAFNERLNKFLELSDLNFDQFDQTLSDLEKLKDQKLKSQKENDSLTEYIQMNYDIEVLKTLNELNSTNKDESCKIYFDTLEIKFNEDINDSLVQKIISKAKNYCNLK